MTLTGEQVVHYRENGYLVLERIFSPQETSTIRTHAVADLSADTPRRVCEANSGLIRAVHGSHCVRPFFADLVRLPRLLGLAEQILGGSTYVHQFKINAKAALVASNGSGTRTRTSGSARTGCPNHSRSTSWYTSMRSTSSTAHCC